MVNPSLMVLQAFAPRPRTRSWGEGRKIRRVREARYFLFILWVYQELERHPTPPADIERLARRDEIRLIHALGKGGDRRPCPLEARRYRSRPATSHLR